jgi:hypothetical protein
MVNQWYKLMSDPALKRQHLASSTLESKAVVNNDRKQSEDKKDEESDQNDSQSSHSYRRP